MNQVSKKTETGIYQTTFSLNQKDIEYINKLTTKFVESNHKLKIKNNRSVYDHYFKVLSICYTFYNFLTKMFNNYNGVNLIGFNRNDFEYKKTSEDVMFKINHPYLHHFKKISFDYSAGELLFHSKIFCDDFFDADISELEEIKYAIVKILFDDNKSIIPFSYNIFENMLGHKNKLKLPKELSTYFKKENLVISEEKKIWIINSFEMYLINQAIEANIINDEKINTNFEKLINTFEKEIAMTITTEKLDLIDEIYELFYMEIYGEILEISRFCLLVSMFLESGILTEDELFPRKKVAQKNPKKLNFNLIF